MTEIANLSLIQAAEAVAAGEITSLELLDNCLARIDDQNERLNAVVWTSREKAREAARRADDAVKSRQPLGPLHGIPLAHKDMFFQAGEDITFGSAVKPAYPKDVTATVIRRMNDAGAFTFAGLHMVEFAMGGTGHNTSTGDCRNAWNPDYISGGSSSGSGVAVAARIAYGSLGSDTGGSIRIPASANGVCGLKPTHSRVSRHGVMPLSSALDTVGPIARDARDCARLLGVIAGRDSLDSSTSDQPVPDYEGELTGDIRSLRIGVPTNLVTENLHPDVQAAYDAALEVFRARGAQLVPVELPYLKEIETYLWCIVRSEGAAIHSPLLREQASAYNPNISGRIFANLSLPASYYIEALGRRGPLLRAFGHAVFDKVDLISMPTIRGILPTRASTDVINGPPDAMLHQRDLLTNTRLFNYLGLPCMTIPCGLDSNALPMGLQFVGRPFSENVILRAADAFQRDTDWHLGVPG